ncbi:MAG: TRAP transporter large permease subunit, partial [bacterium]|nr:TRAP transporter large permease subunit [bacterium]
RTTDRHMYYLRLFRPALTRGLVPCFVQKKQKPEREPFKIKEALISMGKAGGEIMLPVVIVLAYFGGLTTLVESAALAVVYAFAVEVLIHRDLKFKDLPRVIEKCIPIIGGVLIILSLAKGLSYYIIDAEVPMLLTEWVQANIGSKYVFLLLLNIALLITGCFMDIFSAIMVVVPLIIPLGQLFGIHPVHLGIIFLANMELGYLTPPVGLNLFLASYRFNEPLGKLYKDVLPFFFIQLVTVLLITYIPVLSTGLLSLFR